MATRGHFQAHKGAARASPDLRATPAAQLDRIRPLTVVPQRYTMVRPTPPKRPPIFSVWSTEGWTDVCGRARQGLGVVPSLGPGRSGSGLGLTGWMGPRTACKAARRHPQTAHFWPFSY